MGQQSWWLSAMGMVVLGASGCIGAGDEGSTGGTGGMIPSPGQTRFVSADPTGVGTPRGGLAASGGTTSVPDTDDGSLGDGGERSVERGDIYRVLEDGRLLNLNPYRGLQVIDVRDPSAPVVEGRLPLTGNPVEMYVAGNRAFVLLNSYQGYFGSRDDVRVEQVQGGLVVLVDLTNRTAPVELDRKRVRGDIQTSRLTQGGGGTALYVAADLYDWQVEYDNNGTGGGVAVGGTSATTVVKSFAADDDALVEKSELDLGGYVTDIQATPTHLMVARDDFSGAGGSTVALIDISSPDGTMVEGQSVTVAGRVQNKFNMDITGDVMRIVSGSTWSETRENHLQTYDISDIQNVTAIDDCAFGENEDLYATLFQEQSAFFVTYFRTDPFHAFAIDSEGHCAEQSEFIVSGWNDFFRTAFDGSRLVGIGRNDENSASKVAVSLYDITDLQNPTPLLTRAEIALDGAYTEAAWDDRAFSVLEGAVSVLAADGTEETGLVLLPFEGWDDAGRRHIADVQMFTFSATTLTRRGTMSHGTSVRRSFLAEAETAANLSDQELSLFDVSDPDAAEELGRLELAPNYSEVFIFGDYLARFKSDSYYGGYYFDRYGISRPGEVEVIAADADPNTRAVLASFEVPGGTRLKQVGDLLVSVHLEDRTDYSMKVDEVDLHTTVQVYDLKDPEAPRKAGSLESDSLRPSVGGYYYGGSPVFADDCWDCGYYGGSSYWGGYGDGIHVAGDALVFSEVEQQQESLGMVERCWEYAVDHRDCFEGGDPDPDCTYTTGNISCTTPEGGETFCQGEYYSCNAAGECEPTDEKPTRVQRHCDTYEDFRYWSAYAFEVLDLSNADSPALSETITMPKAHEGTSVVVDGTHVYFNFQQPEAVNGDARAYVKRFTAIVDVTNPAAPTVSAPVNIPGEVFAAEGNTLFTKDLIWSEQDTDTMVARLTLSGQTATLQAQQTFPDRAVSTVLRDGAGHLLVSHSPRWNPNGDNLDATHMLTLLDEADLSALGEAPVDDWASLQTAKEGRVLFSVSGGMLIVNTEDPRNPHAQAYLPTNGGGEVKVDGGDMIFAAGPYGIYRFDLDTENLASE